MAGTKTVSINRSYKYKQNPLSVQFKAVYFIIFGFRTPLCLLQMEILPQT